MLLLHAIRPAALLAHLHRSREPLRHVPLEDTDELGHQAVATQRAIEAAVDEHRGDGLLERPLTTQPMTATRSSSAPGCVSRQTGICSLR